MTKKVNKQTADLYFTDAFNDQIDYLAKSKSPFTVENYRNVYRSVCGFMGNKVDTFKIKDVTDLWLNEYVTHIQTSKRLSSSSMNNYYCVLRSVYNKTVKKYSIPVGAHHPFSDIHISVPTTLKRSLMKENLQKLIDFKPTRKGLRQARNLFLFLFYARGMCFVDVFNLRYDLINGDYICYKRSKTSAPLQVKIEHEMREIMDLYREEGNPYVFPFLRKNQYSGKNISEKSSLRRINRQLGKIGEELGFKLTTYVARHSWASMIEECGVSIALICRAMGHSSERVTKTYLKGLPSHVIDNASNEMLNRFFRKNSTKDKKKCPLPSKNETSAG